MKTIAIWKRAFSEAFNDVSFCMGAFKGLPGDFAVLERKMKLLHARARYGLALAKDIETAYQSGSAPPCSVVVPMPFAFLGDKVSPPKGGVSAPWWTLKSRYATFAAIASALVYGRPDVMQAAGSKEFKLEDARELLKEIHSRLAVLLGKDGTFEAELPKSLVDFANLVSRAIAQVDEKMDLRLFGLTPHAKPNVTSNLSYLLSALETSLVRAKGVNKEKSSVVPKPRKRARRSSKSGGGAPDASA